MPRPNPNRPSVERVRELAGLGLSDAEIGEMHGVSRSTIANVRHKRGIAANRRPGAHFGDGHWMRHVEAMERKRLGRERLALAASEDAWATALAGRGYVDAPVPPTVVQRQDRPATSLYAEASS